MEAELRARLTKPQVGCTQAHVDLFVANEVYSVTDMQGMDDGDLEKIGIKLGTRRRVVAEFGAQPSPAPPGTAAPGSSRSSSSSMFTFASDPAAAAAAQAAKSAAQAAASLKALRDGQQGGQKKAANARSVTQLSGSMSAYLSGGSGGAIAVAVFTQRRRQRRVTLESENSRYRSWSP